MTSARATPGRPDEAGVAGTRSPDSLYRAVCDSMISGVMLVDARGRIETFNSAASRILGLDRKAVLRGSFAEVFVANEAFEEFNEALLAAMYDGDVGHQRVANVSVGGATVPLALATTYLRDPAGGEHARRGVVAVFSDVSELERLRATEIRLAGDLRVKHTELRTAYRNLEERNRELATLLRRGRVVRIVGSAGVVALIGGIGAFLWSDPPRHLVRRDTGSGRRGGRR